MCVELECVGRVGTLVCARRSCVSVFFVVFPFCDEVLCEVFVVVVFV